MDTPSPQDIIQDAQMTLGQLQMTYRDDDVRFWAIAVAWEAARFAWYVVAGDCGTADDKLRLLKDTIADFERRAQRR